MAYALLIIPITDKRISAIKCVKEITGWSLYEAKEGVEHGFIFACAETAAHFMRKIMIAVGPDEVSWRVQPYQFRSGPQDARNFLPNQF